MRRFSLLLGFVLSLSSSVFAQNSETGFEELKTGEVSEAPPKPEPPYPGSEIETTPPPYVPKATAEDTWGSHLRNGRAPVSPPPSRRTRPIKVDEYGNYYYDPKVENSKAVPKPGVAAPTKREKSGDYFYDPEDKSTAPQSSGRPVVERPLEIKANGEFLYGTPQPKSRRTASFRVGVMSPPSAKNATADFSTVYGKDVQPVIFGDYEWRLTSKVGRLGLKLTSGLFLASGRGQFVTPRPEKTSALEKFNFFMFPNQATVIYRFQYADTQPFVPYIEGGGAYYTMAELRDDNKSPKFAGAAGLVAAGGLNVLLDWADRRSLQRLNADYGISHVWLSMEGRLTVGVASEVNVSNQAYTAGVMFDF